MRFSQYTSICDIINVVQVNLFGAKIVISCANGVVELPISSVLRENDSIISVLFMPLEKLLQFFFGVKWMNSWRYTKNMKVVKATQMGKLKRLKANLHLGKKAGERKQNFPPRKQYSLHCFRDGFFFLERRKKNTVVQNIVKIYGWKKFSCGVNLP